MTTPATPFAADTDYTIRLQVEGTALRAKWWLAGQPEPSAWAVQVTDTSYASGQSGVKTGVTSKNCSQYYSYYLIHTRTGILQITLGDGSVKGIKDSISQATFLNLVDPSDGNVLGSDF